MSSASNVSDKKTKEVEDMFQFKFDNFVKLLGPDWPLDDIHALVNSDVYHGDLKDLLESGCSKELAVKILL
jgi:hypothetical protein